MNGCHGSVGHFTLQMVNAIKLFVWTKSIISSLNNKIEYLAAFLITVIWIKIVEFSNISSV